MTCEYHPYSTTIESEECSDCSCLSILYEYCHDCGHFELIDDCDCLEVCYSTSQF